jgi:hypothetical protein
VLKCATTIARDIKRHWVVEYITRLQKKSYFRFAFNCEFWVCVVHKDWKSSSLALSVHKTTKNSMWVFSLSHDNRLSRSPYWMNIAIHFFAYTRFTQVPHGKNVLNTFLFQVGCKLIGAKIQFTFFIHVGQFFPSSSLSPAL